MRSSLEDLLVYDNLAFSTPRPSGSSFGDESDDEDVYIKANARAPFTFCDQNTSTQLNVELFGDPSWPRILLFVPGVCESAETWTVQNLVRICISRNWRVAVLELEGHGLSEGSRGLIGSSWNRCIRQVKVFCGHALDVDRAQKRILFNYEPENSRFALAGDSLGGALAAYACQDILKDEDLSMRSYYAGTLLLSPAVGVDPLVVPPPIVVTCLSILSFVLPSVGIEGATPTEDPSHYNCPPWTRRNFRGAWPLGTSKILLDVTSNRVPNDVESGLLNLLIPKVKHTIRVISGAKDPVVPFQAVQNFVHQMQSKVPLCDRREQEQETATMMKLIQIKKGGHGLLSKSIENQNLSKTQKDSMNAAVEHVNAFLKLCEEMASD